MPEAKIAAGSATVLLVEDGPADAELVRQALASLGGTHLDVVADGEAALAYLRGQPPYGARVLPALVLLDLNLPGAGGLEILREMRADPALRQLVAVVLSNSDAAEDIAGAYALGAAAYLVKPTDYAATQRALAAAVSRWLGPRHTLLPAASQAPSPPSPPSVADLPRASQVRALPTLPGGPPTPVTARSLAPQPPPGAAVAGTPAHPPLAQVRVLLVEDSPGDRALVQALLAPLFAPTFVVVAVSSLAEACARGAQEHVDVALLDLGLPDSEGVATFAALHRAMPRLPVVVQSGIADVAVAVEAVQRGAEDYLLKGSLPGDALGRALVHAIARGRHRLGRARLRARERRARRTAEEAVRVRDDFIAIAGHELRTPLHTMTMQLDLMHRRSERRQGPADAERTRASIACLRRQVDRLVWLAENLLDAQRVQAGTLPLTAASVDLAAVATAVVGRMAAQCEAAGVRVALRTDGDARGHWDPTRMEQVVANLLTNAIKYGGDPVEITVHGAHAAGEPVCLIVCDHGPGIAACDHERIFERFQRAGRPRTHEGLGLGLYIVRQVVRAHGGTIAVDGARGEGARFTVTLPGSPA